jgi:tetratricopeptide (TPR) repeat protein
VLVALVALAVAGQAVRAGHRLEANRILHQVEQVSVAAAGRAPAALFWANVKLLARARRLDPADARIPLAIGGQYLLLGRPKEALEAYREALAVEPRPEIYLNLGRAQAAAGDPEAARESFRRAALLDRRMRPAIPQEFQPTVRRPARPSPAP